MASTGFYESRSLIVSMLIFLSVLMLLILGFRPSTVAEPERWQHHDSNGFVKHQDFQPDWRFSLLDAEADQDWENLTEPNGGVIWKVVPEAQHPLIHGVGMFHQLHCLRAIRSVLKDLMDAQKRQHTDIGHAVHCLDYLRQAVLCYADDTEERAEWDEKRKRFVTDGMVPHECRRSEDLYRMLELQEELFPDEVAAWRQSHSSQPHHTRP
ncbi:hypothetical protein AC578_8332 [Pseudocercospora eumusae]|uniref:Oxidase ustYa n=1 Tax=Pseudocercospora eumusae TaxID=321146 RepID=A0A139GWG0_9PEZI|nr:hypothetical protein AC578_8332 [Pseudocercospora eumusae]